MFARVPKDISKIEPKIYKLTVRQWKLSIAGIVIAVVINRILSRFIDNSSIRYLITMFAVMPIGMLLMYKHNGLPAEEIIKDYIQFHFLHPKVSRFKTTKRNVDVSKARNVYIPTKKKRKEKKVNGKSEVRINK